MAGARGASVDVDADGAGKARCCGDARRYGMLAKVTIRLSRQNCICKDVKSQMALPTFFIHGGPKMMSMLLPMGRRKASIWNVLPLMRSGTMKQAP
jgi:hypothetical protein